MALIIGSLCFSAGEGLRLTPFPVFAHPQVEEINDLVGAKYAPLDVPLQVQKRSKRQTTDFTFQPIGGEQFTAVTAHYVVDESLQLRFALFLSRPTGRAPPSV